MDRKRQLSSQQCLQNRRAYADKWREPRNYSPSSDFPTLRVLPLLVTAESKAHAEIGLITAGGHKGCRRCFVSGTYVPERCHYYYGNFQQRYRFPANDRDPASNRQYGRQADSASSCAERKRITRNTGVTGESIFYRFFDLCQFDPVRDAVIDVMHALALNLIRTELEDRLLADLGANSTLHSQERLVSNGELLDRNDLSEALSKVDWTAEMKNGHLPKVCPSQSNGKHKLGYWKSEEYSRLILLK